MLTRIVSFETEADTMTCALSLVGHCVRPSIVQSFRDPTLRSVGETAVSTCNGNEFLLLGLFFLTREMGDTFQRCDSESTRQWARAGPWQPITPRL